jgi:hypothetical protein
MEMDIEGPRSISLGEGSSEMDQIVESDDDNQTVVMAGTYFTSTTSDIQDKKRRRKTDNLAKKHFQMKEELTPGGTTKLWWECSLCRDKGAVQLYKRSGMTSISRLKHLRRVHADHPDVIGVYPESAVGFQGALSSGQSLLTTAYSKQQLLENLACMIAGDNLPLRLVESKHFRAFVGLLSQPAFRDMPSDASIPDAISGIYSKVRPLKFICRHFTNSSIT